MKKIKGVFFLLLALTTWAGAQSFTKAFIGDGTINLMVYNSDVHIEAHSGNDVIIETGDFEPPPDRAKGLRPLSNSGVDNTGVGLQIDVRNKVMDIKKATHQSMDYRIKVPAGANLKVEETSWMGGGFTLVGLKGEVEIKSTLSDIHLKDVSGPVVANSTNGDITVIFSALDQEHPTSISNISGAVDISLPASAKATFDLSTMSGTIYTDLDIKVGEGTKNGLTQLGGSQKMHGQLNGGGVEVTLKSISNDIYIRKN